MQFTTDRRSALASIGAGVMVSGSATPHARADEPLGPIGATSLRDLSRQLAGAPRRRDFKTVPMILDNRDFWDAAALDAVIAYKGGPRQAWDHCRARRRREHLVCHQADVIALIGGRPPT